MRTPRIIVANDIIISNSLEIEKKSARHITKVLRRTIGSNVEIIQKHTGNVYSGVISCINNQKIEITDILPKKGSGLKTAPITLLCAICKPKIMDMIVEKCTEIGIAKIIFFYATRSQGSYNQASVNSRLNRFNRIIDAATKQSGSQDLPITVDIMCNLKSTITTLHSKNFARKPNECRIFCTGRTKDGSQPIKITQFINISNASNLILKSAPKNSEFYVIIGPEGGLTNEELDVAKSYSYEPTSLGAKTLRVETAVILACGFLQFFTTRD